VWRIGHALWQAARVSGAGVSWAAGIAPARVDVECGSELHPLVWRDGELVAPAHPDPEAERALAGPMLHMAVYSRVRTTVHRWQRRTPPEVVLELVPADAERSLTGSTDAGMLARLPLAWLTEVWAPDLDIVAGRLTLAAQPAATPDAGVVQLLTVDSTMRVHIDRFTAG
jgi:hypothetical protein